MKILKYIKNGFLCLENCGNKVCQEGRRCKSCAAKELFKDPKNHPNYGKSTPIEVREKLRKKLRGYKMPPFSKEHKEKIRLGNLGRKHSKETKIKMSQKSKGISLLNRGHKIDCPCTVCKYRRKEMKGKDTPNYLDGRTPLNQKIRGCQEYNNWRIQVFLKDKRTCQECGEKKRDLEAHHIKEFHIIFNEFLQTYNQFSPAEDKETLLKLAITYQPFWDINNGQTLCEDCHDLIKLK